jgi:hypothetical protein
VHAVRPGLIAGSGDNAAATGTTDDHRSVGEGGIQEHFHGRVERVHVDMEDAGPGQVAVRSLP